jgi:hypothetical protein
MKGVNEMVEKRERKPTILFWIVIIVVAVMLIAEFLLS